MQDWLFSFGAQLAQRAGSGQAGWAFDEEAARVLLGLAKAVADGTGDRKNAPLSCYLAGRYAQIRAGDGIGTAQALAEAVDIATAALNPPQQAPQ